MSEWPVEFAFEFEFEFEFKFPFAFPFTLKFACPFEFAFEFPFAFPFAIGVKELSAEDAPELVGVLEFKVAAVSEFRVTFELRAVELLVNVVLPMEFIELSCVKSPRLPFGFARLFRLVRLLIAHIVLCCFSLLGLGIVWLLVR